MSPTKYKILYVIYFMRIKDFIKNIFNKIKIIDKVVVNKQLHQICHIRRGMTILSKLTLKWDEGGKVKKKLN